MSTAEEATVNPDGSTTFENNNEPPVNETAGEEGMFEEAVKDTGIDPAFYLIGAVIVFVVLYFFISRMRKKDENDGDDFFASLDTEKVRNKLHYHSNCGLTCWS